MFSLDTSIHFELSTFIFKALFALRRLQKKDENFVITNFYDNFAEMQNRS